MKNLYFILILLPSCIFAQDDNLYLHCQYDALGLKFLLTGIEREHFRERFGKLQKLWVCGGVSTYILMIVFRLKVTQLSNCSRSKSFRLPTFDVGF